MKNSQITEKQYIQEIEVWKKSSEIHAQKAIEQYKNIVQNIEDFQFEKTRNDGPFIKCINVGLLTCFAFRQTG